jgi:hypothetical protein
MLFPRRPVWYPDNTIPKGTQKGATWLSADMTLSRKVCTRRLLELPEEIRPCGGLVFASPMW